MPILTWAVHSFHARLQVDSQLVDSLVSMAEWPTDRSSSNQELFLAANSSEKGLTQSLQPPTSGQVAQPGLGLDFDISVDRAQSASNVVNAVAKDSRDSQRSSFRSQKPLPANFVISYANSGDKDAEWFATDRHTARKHLRQHVRNTRSSSLRRSRSQPSLDVGSGTLRESSKDSSDLDVATKSPRSLKRALTSRAVLGANAFRRPSETVFFLRSLSELDLQKMYVNKWQRLMQIHSPFLQNMTILIALVVVIMRLVALLISAHIDSEAICVNSTLSDDAAVISEVAWGLTVIGGTCAILSFYAFKMHVIATVKSNVKYYTVEAIFAIVCVITAVALAASEQWFIAAYMIAIYVAKTVCVLLLVVLNKRWQVMLVGAIVIISYLTGAVYDARCVTSLEDYISQNITSIFVLTMAYHALSKVMYEEWHACVLLVLNVCPYNCRPLSKCVFL